MCPIRMAKLESASRLVLAFHEAFNRQDAAGMLQLMSEDCVLEASAPAPDGGKFSGKEAVARYWQDFFRRSPHARLQIEEIFGMGFRCVVRWRSDWQEAGGEKGHVRGVDIFQVRDGLIGEQLSYVKG